MIPIEATPLTWEMLGFEPWWKNVPSVTPTPRQEPPEPPDTAGVPALLPVAPTSPLVMSAERQTARGEG